MTPQTKNVSDRERAASAIAGSMLVLLGWKKGSWLGTGLVIGGAALVGRGLTGHCGAYSRLGITTADQANQPSIPYRQGIRVDRAVTVNKPRFEVYQFWRDLENLPKFMKHLESVRTLTENYSHWTAKGPLGQDVAWEAEILNDVPGELISWRSLPGSQVATAGSVHFASAPGDRGTEIKVELQYLPPGGALGALAAKLFGEDPAKQVECDLRRFKMMIETGEVPTTLHHQPKETRQNGDAVAKEANVREASEQSFPASDAPAWT